jgi:hypothetical protein
MELSNSTIVSDGSRLRNVSNFIILAFSLPLVCDESIDKSFVSWLGVQFTSVVMTGVAVGAGGSGAKSIYVSGTPITTFPFIPISRLAMFLL